MWAAHCRKYSIPKCLQLRTLQEPLRSPPVVVRQIQNTVFKKYSTAYKEATASSTQPPTDGPPVLYVYHQGEGHVDGNNPTACEKCGAEVAKVLTENLGVGKTVTPFGGLKTASSILTQNPEPPLRYRDVLLVTHLKDPFTDVVRTAGGIIKGVHDSGVPIRVVRNDTKSVADLALMAGPDEVAAAEFGIVGGLERKVVVVVDSPIYDDRFYSASRSSSQLVWVTIRHCD